MNFIKSKAAILRQLNKPLEITNILIPRKLLKGQILVKMIYSGICGSQLGEINGIKGEDKYLPHLLGHEGIATVIEANDKVVKVKKGDVVLLHWMPSNGINSKTPIYFDSFKKKINAGYVTTFNEYAIVSENRLTKIKKIIDNLSKITNRKFSIKSDMRLFRNFDEKIILGDNTAIKKLGWRPKKNISDIIRDIVNG